MTIAPARSSAIRAPEQDHGCPFVGRGRDRVVSVAVNDLPLTVLSPVDMRHANGDWLDDATRDRPVEALEPSVEAMSPLTSTTSTSRRKSARVPEARHDPREEGLAELVPARFAHADRPEESHAVASRPQLHSRSPVPVHERLVRLYLARKHRCTELFDLVHRVGDATSGARGEQARAPPPAAQPARTPSRAQRT